MLTLNDGRSELWQFDTGRKMTVDDECSQVHFSNKVFGRSIDVDVVDGVATIPDILLQTDKELTAWAFVGTAENGYTKISKTFKVNRRNKPADYVFTPTEQTTLSELVERLDAIEESQDPDAIKNAVDDYIQNNPIKFDEKDPTVPEWAKQPEKPKYTATEVGALPNTYTPPNQTAEQVGADPKGTADAAVGVHNTDLDSHNDIRLELEAINARLTAFFDSDDQTLDELSEIVAYITSNKTLIDAITTSKVSVADIVNNLTTNVSNKPLSAAQGVVLKELIDGLSTGKLDANKLQEAVNDALAQAKESGEFDGADGEDGTSPVVSVSAIEGGHRITITDANGTKTVNVLDGQNGNDGNGIKSAALNADYTLTLTFDDGTSYTTPSIRGATGEPGYTPVKGTDYNDGTNGKDGTSVTVSSVSESSDDGGSNVVTFSDGKTLTVKNGATGTPGYTPAKGTDYYTEEDKTEMVNLVLAALPTWTGGSY